MVPGKDSSFDEILPGKQPHHIGQCHDEENGRPEPGQHIGGPPEAWHCPELLWNRLLGYVSGEGTPA